MTTRTFSPFLLGSAIAGLLGLALPLVGHAATPDGSRIGRSNVAKAPEFQELYDFDRAALTLPDATFPYEARVHRAHVVMLVEQKILTAEEGRQILRGLDQVDALAANAPELRTYLPYEAELVKRVGHVAGKMHTGRSRNDLANASNRMFYRDQLNRTIEALIELRAAVVEKARGNQETIMVVYTHRKEAQPITLGHYLLGISESLGKSIERYEQLYARLNQSPLGAAAAAGTRWPLDRSRTARLLGFDGLVVNTVEGTAGWDHITEFAADNAIYLSSLSRLASEIQLWTTDEYRSAELDDAFAGTSSIMPQKKNPDSLERTRQIAANAVGQLTSILTSLNAIEYQHSVTRVALEPRSLDAMIAGTRAMTGVVRTLKPNPEQMLAYAKQNFSTMTDLADLLVRQGGIDFREAHEIVATVVVGALKDGLTADQITADRVQRAAVERLGHRLKDLGAGHVAQALDPHDSVRGRDGVGGPGPTAMAAMLEQAEQSLAAERSALLTRRQRLETAAQALEQAERDLEGA